MTTTYEEREKINFKHKRLEDLAQGNIKDFRVIIVQDTNKEIVATIRALYKTKSNGMLSCQVDVISYSDKYPCIQSAKTSGFGYDMFTAALSGMTIDGIKINDHCGEKIEPKNGKWFPVKFKAPKGYYLTNRRKDETGRYHYTSCYRESGLDILWAHGYTVKQVW